MVDDKKEGSEMAGRNLLSLLPPKEEAVVSQGEGSSEAPKSKGELRRLKPRPKPEDLEFQASVVDDVKRHIEGDNLVKSAQGRVGALEMLWHIREEIAKEASALEFQRNECEKVGVDSSRISSRRVEALKKMADVELEIKKMGVENIDLRGEKMQRIFKLWIESIKGVVSEIMSPEQSELFFNRFQTVMEGWEQRASDIVR